MNAHAQSSAVAGPTFHRTPTGPGKRRPSRSKYAHVLDMTDDNEREVARKVRYFELGGDYKCSAFRRSISPEGQRILWAIVDTVPRWRDQYRWCVSWWNIDTGRQGWRDCSTLGRAMALLNHLTLN